MLNRRFFIASGIAGIAVTAVPGLAWGASGTTKKFVFVIQRGAGLIAFHGSALDLTLRRMGVETVVITGVSTNVAIAGMTIAAVEFGYHAVENVCPVHDLHATMLHLLGIDHKRLTFRHQGRQYRLTDVHGEVVKGVLA